CCETRSLERPAEQPERREHNRNRSTQHSSDAWKTLSLGGCSKDAKRPEPATGKRLLEASRERDPTTRRTKSKRGLSAPLTGFRCRCVRRRRSPPPALHGFCDAQLHGEAVRVEVGASADDLAVGAEVVDRASRLHVR